MKLPSQHPPIIRNTSPVRAAVAEKPAQSLSRLLCGNQGAGPCLVWVPLR